MCGEKPQGREWPPQGRGSPPRVRGKDRDARDRRRAGGITPACAGKRLIVLTSLSDSQDHPRVCGEKCFGAVALRYAKGSPPRVRGKARASGPCATACRITPACAGKSRPPLWAFFPAGDHPRVCGEKYALWSCATFRAGSPPRVRGKVRRDQKGRAGLGITPACAGKSYPKGR